jgi:hypothetical protein
MTSTDADESTQRDGTSTEAHLARNVIGPVVLVESAFAPDLGLEVLIAAHHLVTVYRRPDQFLIVTGTSVDEPFDIAIQRYADELNVTRSWLAPDADEATVGAFRRRCDAWFRWDASLAANGAVVLADALAALVTDVPVPVPVPAATVSQAGQP